MYLAQYFGAFLWLFSVENLVLVLLVFACVLVGFPWRLFDGKKISITTYNDVVVIVLLMLPLLRSKVYSVGNSNNNNNVEIY